MAGILSIRPCEDDTLQRGRMDPPRLVLPLSRGVAEGGTVSFAPDPFESETGDPIVPSWLFPKVIGRLHAIS